MTSDKLYSVSVPCSPDSLAVLEELCETFLAGGESFSPEMARIVRYSANEAFRNAIEQKANGDGFRLATVSFMLSSKVPGLGGVSLSITDPGEGLRVEGHVPPYPAILEGREHRLCRLLDQEVVGLVRSPYEVRLRAKELSSGSRAFTATAIESGHREQGLGLLSLCRSWKVVSMKTEPGVGTTLTLQGPRDQM